MNSSTSIIYDTWPTLYKYRAINEYTFSILEKKELFFSTPENFNDPFDAQLDIEGLLSKAITEFDFSEVDDQRKVNTIKQVERDLKTNEIVKKRLAELSKSISISCFSMIADNFLMWSHYANSHTGICLGFDSKEIREKENGSDLITPQCVTYTSENPFNHLLKSFFFYMGYARSGYAENELLTGVFYRFLHDTAISTKTFNWNYEAEFRYIRRKPGNALVKFEPNLLKEIVFGVKTKLSDIEKIKVILNSREYSHVKLKRAVKNQNDIKLKIENY